MKERYKNETIRQTIALVIGCFIILGALWCCRLEYASAIQHSLADKVLRFHVLAQSDSDEDQRIKKAVRDQVAVYVGELLGESESLEETIGIIQMHLQDINQVANDVLEDEGVTYRAQTTLAYTEFPEKEYNDFVFPEGEYRALRVVLGNGQGQNWWCVMYPNLCFSDSLYQTNEEELESFQEVLTPEECENIMDEKDYTIRFKILEYIAEKVYN